jgi:hypothetical protein
MPQAKTFNINKPHPKLFSNPYDREGRPEAAISALTSRNLTVISKDS